MQTFVLIVTRSRMRTNCRPLAKFVLFLMLTLGVAPVVNACQGQDFEESKQIITEAWNMGVRLGEQIAWGQVDIFSALNEVLQESQVLQAQAAALPYSCQVLIQKWNNAIGSSLGRGGLRGGTTCMGGVCCNGNQCL